MLLHYLVDGYNVIHAIPTLKRLLAHDAFSAREQLILHIARLTLKHKFRCTVVFDGLRSPNAPQTALHSPVHVVFSGKASADTHLRSMIEKSGTPAHVVVVSSDREITDFARACSCTTYTSTRFAQMLFAEEERGEEKEQAVLSKQQIEEWLKIFGEKK
jgi:predicted RNA-binding protein with PIN domain